MNIYLNNNDNKHKCWTFDGKKNTYFKYDSKINKWNGSGTALFLNGSYYKEKLEETETRDFTQTIQNKRYRCQLFHSNNGWNLTLRELASKILTWEDLGFSDKDKQDILSLTAGSGLTLFCGPMGAGKSTTMTKVIDEIVTDNFGTAITIEEPIEYLHKKNNIIQREVFTDTKSFSKGVIESRRQTPSLIVIGEIRDSETAIAAIEAALSGVKVFATLHAKSVQHAISKLWAYLDDQGDELLIDALSGIMTQHLIHGNNRSICVYETLLIDDSVKNTLNNVLKGDTNINLLNHAQENQHRKTLKEQKSNLISKDFTLEQISF